MTYNDLFVQFDHYYRTQQFERVVRSRDGRRARAAGLRRWLPNRPTR